MSMKFQLVYFRDCQRHIEELQVHEMSSGLRHHQTGGYGGLVCISSHGMGVTIVDSWIYNDNIRLVDLK